MAPKPTAAKPTSSGKKSAKSKPGDSKPSADANADDVPTTLAAPKNKEEVLAQVNLEGLPNCPAAEIITILRSKYEDLVKVFIYYCKFSDCKTMEVATRLKLGARRRTLASRWPPPPPPLARCPAALPRRCPRAPQPPRSRSTLGRALILCAQLASRSSCATPSSRCPCTTSS